MSHNELRKLFELLQPKKQFPYGIHVLRCFILWAKYTSSVGFNLGLLAVQNESSTSSNVNNNSINQNDANILPGSAGDHKLRRGSLMAINQSLITNMMRTTGTGALSANAQQQAKYFFDFQHSNSVGFF